MERSLVLIKPYAMQAGLGGAIISRIEGNGFKVVGLKMIHMDKDLAQRHYAVHKDKSFFEDLVDYITSAPIIAVAFEGEKAVEVIRQLVGATDPAKANPGTIRADFGLDIRRNAIHGSDSAETAEKEIKLFFSENEIFSGGSGSQVTES